MAIVTVDGKKVDIQRVISKVGNVSISTGAVDQAIEEKSVEE